MGRAIESTGEEGKSKLGKGESQKGVGTSRGHLWAPGAHRWVANSHPSLTRLLLGASNPEHIRKLRAPSGRVAAREMDSRACAHTHGDCCHLDSGVGQRAKRQATNSILQPALVRRKSLNNETINWHMIVLGGGAGTTGFCESAGTGTAYLRAEPSGWDPDKE